MTITTEVAILSRDPSWFPHRYDPQHDAVHFVKLDRDAHRAATFLVDAELPKGNDPIVMLREDSATAAAETAAPLHFIFHSAYCCSTLLARAVDQPGHAMGLKEPEILTDIVGFRRRGGDVKQIGAALDAALTLLAQPFAPGEAVVVKPANIVNGLAPVILAIRPQARAVLLHAPLRTYLGSIAKKGLWGRNWVRQFFVAALKDGMIDLGFDHAQYMEQTDLQIAAAGWLAQQALFTSLIRKYGADRVRSLNSEVLVARPAEAMRALNAFYGLGLSDDAVRATAEGPVFTRHSKFDKPFEAQDRAAEGADAERVHGDEIDKVEGWAVALAKARNIPMVLDAPLLR